MTPHGARFLPLRPSARTLLAVALVLGALSCGRGEPGHWICVSNERSGTVTVIDSGSRGAVAAIRLGKRPRGIHPSPDGRFLYVALSGSPIAGPPGSRADSLPLPPADRSADGIGVIDLRSLAPTRVIHAGVDPEQFAVSPDGARLYVANEETATLSIVRTADGAIERVIPMGEEPEGVGVAPGGGIVVATCENFGDVFLLDATGIPLSRMVISGRPRSVAFTPDGARAFIPAETRGTITVVNLRTREPDTTFSLPSGSRPMGTVVSPDGATLYVSNGRAGTVSFVDVPTLRLRGQVRVGPRPWGLALAPSGRWLYVANGPSNDISIVDTRRVKEVARVPVGEGPWGVAVVPAPR